MAGSTKMHKPEPQIPLKSQQLSKIFNKYDPLCSHLYSLKMEGKIARPRR
jgi:hypothetical protein